jgi:hypothetical protein
MTLAAVAHFFLISQFAVTASADLSATAGQTLLESFRCESTNGSAVQGVKSSLTSLKSTIEKIAEQQKECQADLAGVGKLPEIDSILRQIENHGASEEVRRQENIITEALNDLALVKRMPPSHPDRALYPDEATLQSMVSNARVELIRNRADVSILGGKADRQKYLDGVRQLDVLSQELSSSLRKNSQCFQKNPVLRRQVLTGLVGIAGFFAKTPAGIGITLAGRVLQNIFDIGDSNSIKNNQNFESSQQTLLSAGLSCTMENLATQHCKLIRQDGLLQQLKEKPCKDGECSPEMKQLLKVMEKGKSATDAVTEVTSWLGGKTDNSSDQAIAMKINSDFLSATSQFEASVNSASEKARQGESSSLSEVQKQSQYTTVQSVVDQYANQLYGSNPAQRMFGGGGGVRLSAELQSLFAISEKRKHVLNFLFDDKEIIGLLSEAVQTINSSQRLKQKYGVEGLGGQAGERTPEEAAMSVLQSAFYSSDSSSIDVPAAQKVKDRMTNRAAFDRIKSRLAQYKSSILQRTTVQPKDEQLGNFIMAFLQEDLGKPSTLKNFENIQAFFDSIPDDFLKSRDPILNISTLKKEVDEIVSLGSGLDTGGVQMSKEKVNELLGKVNKLLDPGRGFKDRIANIASSVGSFQTQKLSRFSKGPQDLNDLVFLQNKDFLESVYDMKNPYQKEVDTKTAIALSASQIDSFGKFFESYMDPALQMLNKSDIRGNKFSDGLSENIDRSLKDHFCIQALALTTIPDRIKKECQNASLKMGNNMLNFIDYEKSQHKERVCAYRNFVNRIDFSTNKREQPNRSQKAVQ